jgi:tRNA threonylcarbamoyladenosine biosynthesis protein TsaB
VLLLAIDTATPAVTVAVHDGRRVLSEAHAVDPQRHGELLTPQIAQVLAAAGCTTRDISDIAVGVGPGPFTGLRVGLVTARTLSLVLGIPVYGVCTLDVLAAEAVDAGAVDRPFLVATDARRKEVYWATYDEDGNRLDGPHVDRPAVVAERHPGMPVVGRGAALYPDAFPDAVGPLDPDAGVLAAVVTEERAELLDPEPLYLRRPDAATPGTPKKVS